MNKLEIIECTLRDGSYPISYQFTAEDTALIAAGLEDAGFRMIEIGHGLGLGASQPDIGEAAAADEEYLEAAAAVLKHAKFGAFFIPGIADEAKLYMAARYGMGFVRIGTNVTETEQAQRFIEIAKDLGMQVSANLMKTYAVPFDQVVRRAQALEKWGADIIAIVDSAGGMLPAEVSCAVRELRQAIGVKVGFHGHNNMQLAIANTLAAVEAGAEVVDSTLRGLGRSSGNAQTEVLVMILEKMGRNPGIDVYKTMDLGEKVIGPIARGRGVDSIELTTGYALFHSSYLQTVFRAAREMQIDPRELIIRVSEIDKIKVSDELAHKVAAEIKQEKREPRTIRQWEYEVPKTSAAVSVSGIASQLAREVHAIAAKSGRSAVFTLAGVPAGREGPPTFPFIRSYAACVIGNAEVSHVREAEEIARAVDGWVDVVMVDASASKGELAEMATRVRDVIRKSRCLTYKDGDALVRAGDAFLDQTVKAWKAQAVCICGAGDLAWKLAVKLAQRGAQVTLLDPQGRAAEAARSLNALLASSAATTVRAASDPREVLPTSRLVIGAVPRMVVITEDMVRLMPADTMIIDIGVGTLSREAVAEAVPRGFRLYRMDMRAGLASEVVNVLETESLIRDVMGTGEVAGVRVVAGGIIGQHGDVVLDSAQHPTTVIGVADGEGHIIRPEKDGVFAEQVRKVRQAIVASKLA